MSPHPRMPPEQPRVPLAYVDVRLIHRSSMFITRTSHSPSSVCISRSFGRILTVHLAILPAIAVPASRVVGAFDCVEAL